MDEHSTEIEDGRFFMTEDKKYSRVGPCLESQSLIGIGSQGERLKRVMLGQAFAGP